MRDPSKPTTVPREEVWPMDSTGDGWVAEIRSHAPTLENPRGITVRVATLRESCEPTELAGGRWRYLHAPQWSNERDLRIDELPETLVRGLAPPVDHHPECPYR